MCEPLYVTLYLIYRDPMNMNVINLALFFTRDVSLQTWAQNGSLEREIALYLRLQEKGVKVSFITYGGRQDLKYANALQGIEILCNRWNLPQRWYERLIPFLHMQALRRADVIKTNQTNGADVALRAAHFWHKPLIARCGYMWSEFAERRGSQNETALARKTEKHVFERAQRVVVTTIPMREFIARNYNIDPARVTVLPNYVMTDIFSPDKTMSIPNRICFVGRLVEQKNLFSLLQACEGLQVELHMVGEGPLRSSLLEQAARLGVGLTLHGNIPHHQIPEMIRRSAIFALVSTHEGHPKSLLEAMSCGAAVLGADSPGIREQIVHGKTGWISGTDPASIRAGIRHLLSHAELRRSLGANARTFIEKNYSLDHIVEIEYSMLQKMVNGEIE
jgi:glycosyltransferase involved in cell wall biosynthesis